MKIKTSLTSLSVLLLVIGCNQRTTTTSTDETNQPVTAQREFTNTLTPTSRDTNYARDTGITDAEKAASKEADNTGRNVRDRAPDALTPGDQGGSKEDIEITRNIRKAVMDQGELSTTAKNIKIITSNGKVTLRGPVNSAEEQQAIGTIAQGVAGVTSVDNQLEVKTNK